MYKSHAHTIKNIIKICIYKYNLIRILKFMGMFNMNKWFLSDGNEVTGPFDLGECNKSIEESTILYAWRPSYSHWLPVSHIEDFNIPALPPVVPLDIPDAYLEELIEKKKGSINVLGRVEKTMNLTSQSLKHLDVDIDNFKKVTNKLNDEVQVAVQNIEQQYKDLQKNLSTNLTSINRSFS